MKELTKDILKMVFSFVGGVLVFFFVFVESPLYIGAVNVIFNSVGITLLLSTYVIAIYSNLGGNKNEN